MAEKKKLSQIQSGGPKYPDKRRINLYQRESKKNIIALQVSALMVFLVFLYGFSQIGVVLPIRRVVQAEAAYRFMEEQLERLKDANSSLPEVTEEYAHYGNSWQDSLDKQIPDRLVMMEVLKNRIFPLCRSIPSVSITGDYMDFNCILERGTLLPELVREIEQDESVRYVTSSLGEVDGNDGRDSVLAADKLVLAHITVYFKVPGESGEK